jgi:hypothetical protein
MERSPIVHVAIGFAAARAWEIEQELAMTPDERLDAARELKRRVYGTDAPDVREAERLVERIGDTRPPVEVCIIGLQQLVKNKQAAGRAKDQDDLEFLTRRQREQT